jgi:hypothetical protein
MNTHFNVLSETEDSKRSSRMQITKAWEQLGDKVQIVNQVIKFASSKTMEDLNL